jgi:hypothetical protein
MDMRSLRLGAGWTLAAALVLSPVACADDVPGGTAGDGDGDGDGDAGDCAPQRPYQDEWDTVVDGLPFPTTEIRDLSIGGRLTNDNFANRGDIDVYYVHEDEVITVQLRRFTWASSEEDAHEAFDAMDPWLFAEATPSPAPDPENDCTVGAWKDDCRIRVWYDGLVQPLRDGADLRVFLPKTWEGSLTLATEDDEQESELYPRRSRIRVKGARGSVLVDSIGAGEVEIEMSEDLEEAPLDCDEAQHLACEAVGWTTTGICIGPASCGDAINEALCEENTDGCSWETCSCGTGSGGFGAVVVESIPGRATDITVELPSQLWATVRTQNEQPGMNPASDPLCEADLRCEDFGSCLVNDALNQCADPDICWKQYAELNDPGDLAAPMAGFRVDLTSSTCNEVPTVTEPSECGSPQSVLRGALTVCSDCLDLPVP